VGKFLKKTEMDLAIKIFKNLFSHKYSIYSGYFGIFFFQNNRYL